MARVKVQAYDTEKAIVVEEGATKGATLGVNVYDEDGNVLTLAQLIALANDAVEDSPLSATAWRLIQDIPPNVTALEEAVGTGIFAVTGDGTGAFRTLQPPAAGIAIANPGGVAGDPTFALANDLAAVEGLAGTGIAVRTAADTWAQRQVEVVAGSAAALSVANPAGVAGNIQFTLDQTLVALAGQNWALNALPIGTGADTVSQVAFAANTLPARASTGDLVAKTISDDALAFVAAANDAAMRTELGLGTVAVRNEGNNGADLVPLLSSPGPGQTSLRITGSSGRANYEMESANADGTGVGEGSFVAYGNASVSSSTEKRLVYLGFNTSGTTANHRGGLFQVALKQNGTTTLSARMTVDYDGTIGFGGTTSAGGGSRVYFFANAATVPTTNPTGGFILYGDSGSAKVRTPGGNTVTVAQNTAPSVTGSRGGNAALASLLTTLAAAGIIADNTTA